MPAFRSPNVISISIRRALTATTAALVLPCGGLFIAGAAQAQATAPTNEVIAKAAKEPGAQLSESGLVFRSIKEGSGPSPTATDTVKVHYRGTFPDGREFDSSYKRGQAIEFPLDRVIKCWTEGVQKLKVGGSAKLTCPPAIAYGERGAGASVPPNATLIFEVELLGIRGR